MALGKKIGVIRGHHSHQTPYDLWGGKIAIRSGRQ